MNNSVSEDLNRTITWQFDGATGLIAIIEMLKKFCEESTEKFWDNIERDVYDIETANDWGLSVWGSILKIPNVFGDTELYRKILLATTRLLNSAASNEAYRLYFEEIGLDVEIVEDGADNEPMHLSFVAEPDTASETVLNLLAPYIPYPSGVKDNDVDGKMMAIPDDTNMNAAHTELTAASAAANPRAGKLDESTFNWNEEHLEVE